MSVYPDAYALSLGLESMTGCRCTLAQMTSTRDAVALARPSPPSGVGRSTVAVLRRSRNVQPRVPQAANVRERIRLTG
jgi:hypothetical protein